jgi:predicted nucleotidyltransferase component of viral defense system
MLYNSKHHQASVLDIVRHLTYYHFYNQEQRNFIEREYAEDNIYNKANLALYEKVEDTFVEVEYKTIQLSNEDKQKVAHNVSVICDLIDNKLTDEEFENSLQKIEREELDLQKCEIELIELVRNIDVSVYKNIVSEQDENEDFLNTNYEKMYDEDTTEVFFKCFVVAIAQLIQQKLNVSFNDALIKCTKFNIYDRYMQAETVDEIVEYAIKYKRI